MCVFNLLFIVILKDNVIIKKCLGVFDRFVPNYNRRRLGLWAYRKFFR